MTEIKKILAKSNIEVTEYKGLKAIRIADVPEAMSLILCEECHVSAHKERG